MRSTSWLGLSGTHDLTKNFYPSPLKVIAGEHKKLSVPAKNVLPSGSNGTERHVKQIHQRELSKSSREKAINCLKGAIQHTSALSAFDSLSLSFPKLQVKTEDQEEVIKQKNEDQKKLLEDFCASYLSGDIATSPLPVEERMVLLLLLGMHRPLYVKEAEEVLDKYLKENVAEFLKQFPGVAKSQVRDDIIKYAASVLAPHAAAMVATMRKMTPSLREKDETEAQEKERLNVFYGQQDTLISVLKQILANHKRKDQALPLQNRMELKRELASIYGDNLGRSTAYANLRAEIVDEEVRQHAELFPEKELFPDEPFHIDQLLDITTFKYMHENAVRVKSSTATETRAYFLYRDQDGKNMRPKNIKYGPRFMMVEDVDGKCLKLTGQRVPRTQQAIVREGGSVGFYLNSQLISGFRDLGKFVWESETIKPMIKGQYGAAGIKRYEKERDKFESAVSDLEEKTRLLPHSEDAEENSITRSKIEANQRKFLARSAVLKLLKEDFQQKMAATQFKAQGNNNNDYLNFDFCNAGPDAETEMVSMDHGNSGINRFKGGQEDDTNFDLYANRKALLRDPFPPPLIFRPEYKSFRRINGNLVPAKVPGLGRTNIGSISRSIPTGPTVRIPLAAERRIAEFGGDLKIMRQVPAHAIPEFRGQISGAFQCSIVVEKIKNEKLEGGFQLESKSLDYITRRYWAEPDNEDIPYKETDTIRPTAQQYAEMRKQHYNELAEKFTPQEIYLWLTKYPKEAEAAYNETAAAIDDETGICIPPFSFYVDKVSKAADEYRERQTAMFVEES